MKDLGLTKPKGMNRSPKATHGGKDTGQQTGGASLKTGFKVVTPKGDSPRAVSRNVGKK